MKGEAIDLAVETAERLANEDRERAQVEYEFVEDALIDERIDSMTIGEIYEAIEKDDDWMATAQNAAQSDAKDAHYLALGKIMGHMIQAYAKRLVELGK